MGHPCLALGLHHASLGFAVDAEEPLDRGRGEPAAQRGPDQGNDLHLVLPHLLVRICDGEPDRFTDDEQEFEGHVGLSGDLTERSIGQWSDSVVGRAVEDGEGKEPRCDGLGDAVQRQTGSLEIADDPRRSSRSRREGAIFPPA
jgi:hypothetical protein